MKGSTKRSKLPIEVVNAERKAKIDKLNDAQDVKILSDEHGVRIVSGNVWIGISPLNARKISALLLVSATDSENKKKDKDAK